VALHPLFDEAQEEKAKAQETTTRTITKAFFMN